MTKRSKMLWVASTVICLLALRVSAPVVITYYFNEYRLADLGDYRGRIDDVDLMLWRGAFRVEGAEIEKARGKQWVNFIEVPTTEVALSWRALFNGAIRAELLFDQPEVNFVDADDAEERQTASGFDWGEGLIDFTFEEITIRNGTLAFRNFLSEPQVNLQAQNVNIVAVNLTNVADRKGRRVASLRAGAHFFDNSPFVLDAEFDPFDHNNFEVVSEWLIKDVRRINSFARAYANLDFESGKGNIALELSAENGILSGYLQPAFENLGIFDWEPEAEKPDKNPLQLAWEGLAGGVVSLFSNPRTDTFASRIDISGTVEGETVLDTWSAVAGILHNAFIEALNANFEHITPLGVEADDSESDE